MRWFIVFLLIANILLFFWVQQDALRPASHGEIPPPEIGELRLLNEPPAPERPVATEPALAAEDGGAVANAIEDESAVPETTPEVAAADTRVEAAARVVEPQTVLEQQDALAAKPSDHRATLVRTYTLHIEPGHFPKQLRRVVG